MYFSPLQHFQDRVSIAVQHHREEIVTAQLPPRVPFNFSGGISTVTETDVVLGVLFPHRQTLAVQSGTLEASDAPRYDNRDPPPPKVTAQDVEKARLTWIRTFLGEQQVKGYMASSEDQKDALLQQAFMQADHNERATWRMAHTPKHQWIQSWKPDFSDDRTSTMLIEEMNDPRVLGSKIIQDFLQANRDKVSKMPPLSLTELQMRIAAAYLQVPEGLGFSVWLALSPTPKVRDMMLSMFCPSPEACRNLLTDSATPEQRVERVRNQLLSYYYKAISPGGMKDWGNVDTAKSMHGDPAIFGPFYESGYGLLEVSNYFGQTGTSLFNAGSDGTGPAPSDASEKEANRIRLYAAANAFLFAQQFAGMVQQVPH